MGSPPLRAPFARFRSIEQENTLRARALKAKPTPRVTGRELAALNNKLNLSQPFRVTSLTTSLQTLQNYEQGIAAPANQAIALIKLMEQYPDMSEDMQQP